MGIHMCDKCGDRIVTSYHDTAGKGGSDQLWGSKGRVVEKVNFELGIQNGLEVTGWWAPR